MHGRSARWILGLISLLVGLAACQSQPVETEPQDLFIPPTLAATPEPTPLPTFTPLPPSPPPPCEDNLLFLEDLTIPDGTRVSSGMTLDKRWRVRNVGTCNWDDRYRLRLIAGEALGAAPEQALFPARSGTELDLQIRFAAPNQPGLFRSAWQAHNPQGEPFGDPIFIEVVVESATATPQPAN